MQLGLFGFFFHKSHVMRDDDKFSLDDLYVYSMSCFVRKYNMQSDSWNEQNSIVDHPPTLLWNPRPIIRRRKPINEYGILVLGYNFCFKRG